MTLGSTFRKYRACTVLKNCWFSSFDYPMIIDQWLKSVVFSNIRTAETPYKKCDELAGVR